MIRKILKPTGRNISIDLLEDFLGKQVEIIAFTIDEAIAQSYVPEKVLAKEWLTPDEDKAWQDL